MQYIQAQKKSSSQKRTHTELCKIQFATNVFYLLNFFNIIYLFIYLFAFNFLSIFRHKNIQKFVCKMAREKKGSKCKEAALNSDYQLCIIMFSHIKGIW